MSASCFPKHQPPAELKKKIRFRFGRFVRNLGDTATVHRFYGLHCEKTCTLDCVHGGLPNANCTACTTCLGGWTGATCDTFNNTIDNVTLLATYTTLFGNLAAEQTAWATAVETAHPVMVPGWSKMGAGVDLLPKLGKSLPSYLMMYNFTFAQNLTISDKTHKFTVPDQVKATPVATPAAKVRCRLLVVGSTPLTLRFQPCCSWVLASRIGRAQLRKTASVFFSSTTEIEI